MNYISSGTRQQTIPEIWSCPNLKPKLDAVKWFLGYNLRIMLKRLAILAGAALIVAVISVAVYYQQRNAVGQGYDIKCIQDSQPSPASGSLACVINQSQNTQHGHSSPHWWDVLIAWPEGITAWLLLLTLGAIVWQAWETRKSARGAKEAAQAALLNAQALINSERPWILVKVDASKGVLGFDGFDITAINRGRTPASIVSYSSNCLIVDEGETMQVEPEYGKMKTVSEILLPGEPTHLDSVGSGTVAMYCVSEEKWRRVVGMEAWAYFVGRIVYRDLLGPADTPPHETQWAFCYVQGSGEDFHLTPFTPPPGWTKHT